MIELSFLFYFVGFISNNTDKGITKIKKPPSSQMTKEAFQLVIGRYFTTTNRE